MSHSCFYLIKQLLHTSLLAGEPLNNSLPAPVVVTSGLAGGTKGGQCDGCFWTNSNILKFSFRISWGDTDTIVNTAESLHFCPVSNLCPQTLRKDGLVVERSKQRPSKYTHPLPDPPKDPAFLDSRRCWPGRKDTRGSIWRKASTPGPCSIMRFRSYASCMGPTQLRSEMFLKCWLQRNVG